MKLLYWLAVTGVAAAMLWIRLRPIDDVLTDSGVKFIGVDPWYHARVVRLTASQWPATPAFDPWTNYPDGTGRHAGFGALYDQIIAGAARAVSARTEAEIDRVTAVAPAVVGALTAVPVYALSTTLMPPTWALAPAVLLGITGGAVVKRSTVGVSDHQSGELLFSTVALASVAVAMQAPTNPGVVVSAGIGIASYLLLWGPALHCLAPVGAAAAATVFIAGIGGGPPESTVGVVGALLVASVVTGVYALVFTDEWTINGMRVGVAQPLLLGAAAGTITGVAGVAEMFNGWAFAAAAGGFVALVGAGAIAHPEGALMVRKMHSRAYSFDVLGIAIGGGHSGQNVAEMSPGTLEDLTDVLGPLVAVGGVGWVAAAIAGLQGDAVALLLALWTVHVTAMYLSMTRFELYLVVSLLVLSGYGLWTIAALAPPVGAAAAVGVVALALLSEPVGAVGSCAPWRDAGRLGGVNREWWDACRWLRRHTPELPLDYDTVYPPLEDGMFDYPDRSYGVLAWWDTGHWITEWARRPAVTNPFTEGTTKAAAFWLAQTEARAEAVLAAYTAAERYGAIQHLSTAELRDRGGDPSAVRYVMIDDHMVSDKFPTIVSYHPTPEAAYTSPGLFRLQDELGLERLAGLNYRYTDSMLSRLYFDDAAGLAHYRLVYEHAHLTTFASVARRDGDAWETVDVNRRLTTDDFDRVADDDNRAFYDVRQASRLKVFERVTGATITGTAPTDGTVRVYLDIRVGDREFTYTQAIETDDDNAFAVTVPYPTLGGKTGLDAPQPTDTAVEAAGPYRVLVGNPVDPDASASVHVDESAIYTGATVEVDAW